MYIDYAVLVIAGILFILLLTLTSRLWIKRHKTKTLLMIKQDLILLRPYFMKEKNCTTVENVQGNNNFYEVKDTGIMYNCRLHKSRKIFCIIKGMSFDDVLLSIVGTIHEIDCVINEIHGIITSSNPYERSLLNDMLNFSNN